MTQKLLKKIRDVITVDNQVMGGKPVIKGTRIPAYLVLEYLANGWSISDITRKFPTVKLEYVSSLLAIYSKEFIINDKNKKGLYSLG